jgi:hypothetical protein
MRIGEFPVPGTDMIVNGGFDYANDSLAGESSGTETANKGIKPKSFTVSLKIPYDDANDLTALVRIAEAVDASGSQVVYDVVDITLNTFNVRKARFDRNFRASENESIMAWDVSFSLTEVSSTAEKVEMRKTMAESSSVATAGTQPAALPFNVETGLTSEYEQMLNYTQNTFNA